MRNSSLAMFLLASVSVAACSGHKPPEIAYDDLPKPATTLPDPPKPEEIVQIPQP